MPTVNEQHLCEAVIRLCEAELGASREDVTFPEHDHSGPPVEVRLKIGPTRLAIEHTLVEPFAAAIQTGLEFEELARPILDALDGTLPKPGTYRLHFPEHPTAGRPRKTHAALRGKIIDWVREKAADLHAESPTRESRERQPFGYQGKRAGEVDGLPMSLERVVSWAEDGRHDGRLFPYRVVDDVEHRRQARIATALDKKLPKLGACHDAGDVTILILEYADVALSNQVLVAQAVDAALGGRAFWPDHIFLADTTIDGHWNLFHPLAHGVFDLTMQYIDVPHDLQTTSRG